MTIKEGTVLDVAGKRIPLPEGQVLIDGEWMKASSDKSFPAINPANKERIIDVAAGNADDIKMAVESSRRAFEQKWTTMNPPERARIIYRIAELMYERREELATIESLDNGKPLREALGDVDAAAHCFEYYAGVADKLFGQTIPYHNRYLVYTLREPIGVCANITPWNYPLFLGCRGLAPAIAAGNAAVLIDAGPTGAGRRSPARRPQRGARRRQRGGRSPGHPPRHRPHRFHRLGGDRHADCEDGR